MAAMIKPRTQDGFPVGMLVYASMFKWAYGEPYPTKTGEALGRILGPPFRDELGVLDTETHEPIWDDEMSTYTYYAQTIELLENYGLFRAGQVFGAPINHMRPARNE